MNFGIINERSAAGNIEEHRYLSITSGLDIKIYGLLQSYF